MYILKVQKSWVFFPDFQELFASVTTFVIHLLQIWCQSQKPPSDDQMHFENPTSKPLKYAYVPQYKYTYTPYGPEKLFLEARTSSWWFLRGNPY